MKIWINKHWVFSSNCVFIENGQDFSDTQYLIYNSGVKLVPEEGVREALWKLRKHFMSALGGVLLGT